MTLVTLFAALLAITDVYDFTASLSVPQVKDNTTSLAPKACRDAHGAPFRVIGRVTGKAAGTWRMTLNRKISRK